MKRSLSVEWKEGRSVKRSFVVGGIEGEAVGEEIAVGGIGGEGEAVSEFCSKSVRSRCSCGCVASALKSVEFVGPSWRLNTRLRESP